MHTETEDVELNSVVHEHASIHVLHGGVEDQGSVACVLQHLQRTWMLPVLHPRVPADVRDLVNRMRTDEYAVVAVPASAVALAPDDFDRLVKGTRATVVVAVPVASVRPAAPAYPKETRVTVIALPSAAVDGVAALRAACRVYRCPVRTRQLLKALVALPHAAGCAWQIAASAVPTYVRMQCATPVDGPGLTSIQIAADRVFFWNQHARPAAVPSAPLHLVLPARSMLTLAVQFSTDLWHVHVLGQERAPHGESMGFLVGANHVVVAVRVLATGGAVVELVYVRGLEPTEDPRKHIGPSRWKYDE